MEGKEGEERKRCGAGKGSKGETKREEGKRHGLERGREGMARLPILQCQQL